jgi:hypothetical protein
MAPLLDPFVDLMQAEDSLGMVVACRQPWARLST